MSYEELLELPYLDLVIHESLRMNPPIVFNNRVCSENIELETVKGHKVLIEKGLKIFIPMLSIQHDPGESLTESSKLQTNPIRFKNIITTPKTLYPRDLAPSMAE
jgi:hypothetical protein